MKHRPVVLVLATGFIGLCGTASSQAPPENLRACSRIADPGERVRCYDAQMAAMTAAPATVAPPSGSAAIATPSAAAPPAAMTPPAPAVATEASPPPGVKFGQDDLPEKVRPARPAEESLLLSTITEMRSADPNIYYISLANGQVWRQQGTQITMFFHVGNDVHIEKGFLGQYRMWTSQTGAKNWVQVSRIR